MPRYAEPGLRNLFRKCGKFLERLDLDGAPRVNDDCIKTIAKLCPALKQLGLDGCTAVTDEGMVEIGRGCHKLERLRAAGCGGDYTRLSDKTAQALGLGCPCLKFLDVSRCAFTREGLRALAAGCRKLEVLKFYGCYDVEDEGIDAILTFCTCLKVLNVGSCDLVSDACLAHVQNARELRTLDARRVNKGKGFQGEIFKEMRRITPIR